MVIMSVSPRSCFSEKHNELGPLELFHVCPAEVAPRRAAVRTGHVPRKHETFHPVEFQCVRSGHGRNVLPRVHGSGRPQVRRSRRQPGPRDDLGEHRQMAARAVDVLVHTGFVSENGETHGFRRTPEKHRHRRDAAVRGGPRVHAENESDHGRALRLRRMGVQARAREHVERRAADAEQLSSRDRHTQTVSTRCRRSGRYAHQRAKTFTRGVYDSRLIVFLFLFFGLV